MAYQVPHDAMADKLRAEAQAKEPAKPAKAKPDPRFGSKHTVTTRQSYSGSQSPKFLEGGPAEFPITLADGLRVDAGRLRWRPLLDELQRLQVPGISTEMGKDALLQCYARYLDAQASKLKPGEPGYETQRVIENGGKWVG